MIKPKSQSYRVKVMLIKLQAVTNRVSTRCHASIKINGDEKYFKAVPQLKKNVALFNSEVEFDNFIIQVDEVTGLYEAKSAVLQLQIETQGNRIRMGEVSVNLGGILNQKKYRIVSQYPLAKCYDKTAKVRLSVDFIPLGGFQQSSEKKQRREVKTRQHFITTEGDTTPISLNERRSPHIKSRLAQESNVILQQKIFEYEQKMDNYRLSQTQFQEKLQEQINSKDQQITQLTIQANRRAQQIAASNLENEQLRFRIKEQTQQIGTLKQQKRSLLTMYQALQKSQEGLRKELTALQASLDNLGKAKQNKEKHYNQELAKYTARYLDSQQERNKIIFELQSKFKEEMEKKQTNYRTVLMNSEKKYQQIIHTFKEKIKHLEHSLAESEEKIEQSHHKNVKTVEQLNLKTKESESLKLKYSEVCSELQRQKKICSDLQNELQTLNFSYNEMDRDLLRVKQDAQSSKKLIEQLRMQLVISNQTIDEHYKTITKNNRELQVHQERQYYLTVKYQDQLQMKSINEENIKGQSYYYREQIQRLKGQLRIAEERAEEESLRASELADSLSRVEMELTNRGQNMMRLGEQKMTIESELKLVRNQLADMEQAVLVLKEENMQLNDLLQEKKTAVDNDKSLEWSYKIEELQNDIAQMLQKFRIEKQHLRENYRRDENKRKEEVNQLNNLLRKAKDEVQQHKKTVQRKDLALRQLQKTADQLKDQLKNKGRQYDEVTQRLRLNNIQFEQVQSKYKSNDSSLQNRLREAQNKRFKEANQIKRLQQQKTGLQKGIQILLQYLSKSYQSAVSFQELMIPDLQGQYLNLINLSLRKHCEQRNKAKQQIKKLQTSLSERTETKKMDLQPGKERINSREISEKQLNTTKIINSNYETWRPQNKINNSFILDDVRDQNSRLKRQISELKLKIRNVEQDVSKAERAADTERQERNEAKRELQDVQDELDQMTFQLKRKEKAIVQLQTQLQELQTEMANIKTYKVSPHKNEPTERFSRSQRKVREKEQNIHSNRREIVIRDLQSRLEAKNKYCEQSQAESSKLRSQSIVLKETVTQLHNELKLLQSKYKDRCSKLSSQETQYLQSKNRLEEEIHSQALAHKRELQDLAQNLLKSQDQSIHYQKLCEHLRNQVEQLERKMKSMRQEIRQNQNKNKREYEGHLVRLKEHVNELEGIIVGLRSDLDQAKLRQQEQSFRNSSQASLLTKRTQQIDRLAGIIRQKDQQIFELQQKVQVLKSDNQRTIHDLRQTIQQLQEEKVKKDYELQQYKFTSEGRILDLQKQLQEALGR